MALPTECISSKFRLAPSSIFDFVCLQYESHNFGLICLQRLEARIELKKLTTLVGGGEGTNPSSLFLPCTILVVVAHRLHCFLQLSLRQSRGVDETQSRLTERIRPCRGDCLPAHVPHSYPGLRRHFLFFLGIRFLVERRRYRPRLIRLERHGAAGAAAKFNRQRLRRLLKGKRR